MSRWALGAALLYLGGCTEDAYVIGAVCPAVAFCPTAGGGSAGGGSAGTGGSAGSGAQPPGAFVLDLTGSGPERLPAQLFGVEAAQLFVASDATPSVWPARRGDDFEVLTTSALELDQPSPFADAGSVLRCSGGAAFTTDGDWASAGQGALAIEAVFRGEPGSVLLTQRQGASGVSLSLDSQGRLSFRLGDGAAEVTASSEALVPDAWHHCLALVDRELAEAQVICNAHAGPVARLPAGFDLARLSVPATVGSESASALVLAELASFRSASFGPRGGWLDQARERFARLVGTYADGAREPLPLSDVREGGAYIDMSPSEAPERRRLHPVGAHWPRIVCRPTSEPRTCGLLVEASSSQPIAAADFALDRWQSRAVALIAASAEGPTGSASLFGVVPSADEVAHALELTLPFGDGPAVLSVFARAGTSKRLRAEVVGVASATFDLSATSVLEADGARVSDAEPWGDGLLRLSYSFDVQPGDRTVRLSLLADDGADTFVGDGSVAAHLGDVELRFRSYSTPLPTFGAIQRADQLIYPAGNRNLAGGPYFELGADLWLPDAPLLADAAIVNANFSDRFDQQINLFVSPTRGAVQFWGLQGEGAAWQLSHDEPVNDGRVHRVVASVRPEGASVTVDGVRRSSPAQPYDTSILDRVQLGASVSSSGPLTGLVRRVQIATSTE